MAKSSNPIRPPVVLDHEMTMVVVIEMSLKSWLVTALVPGLDRRPLQKLGPDQDALLCLLERWRSEGLRAGARIERLAVAYEAGRDGFWLARWLRHRGVECYVIHPTSVAVSREGRRAKTDRLDTALLMRAFVGWRRAEPEHCRPSRPPRQGLLTLPPSAMDDRPPGRSWPRPLRGSARSSADDRGSRSQRSTRKMPVAPTASMSI